MDDRTEQIILYSNTKKNLGLLKYVASVFFGGKVVFHSSVLSQCAELGLLVFHIDKLKLSSNIIEVKATKSDHISDNQRDTLQYVANITKRTCEL